jgi:hypothetical protein
MGELVAATVECTTKDCPNENIEIEVLVDSIGLHVVCGGCLSTLPPTLITTKTSDAPVVARKK